MAAVERCILNGSRNSPGQKVFTPRGTSQLFEDLARHDGA